jgi:hypothetical protein
MPVGLSQNTARIIKSESAAISANYVNLSTFSWPTNIAWLGGLSLKPPAAYLGPRSLVPRLNPCAPRLN